MAPRRLIRRQPLIERIKAYLDPWDFLLWLSEKLDSGDWDEWQKDWATPAGLGLNFVMLVARANSGSRTSRVDDVFGDVDTSSGWLGWLVSDLEIKPLWIGQWIKLTPGRSGRLLL